MEPAALPHGTRPGGASAEAIARVKERPTPDGVTRIMLRPIASSLALGFLGLVMGTIALAALQLKWIPAAQQDAVGIAVIAFVVPLQAVASVFGFLGRDAVAATGLGILAGTWGVVGWVLLASPPGSTSKGLAIALFVSAVSMLVPASTALAAKLVPAAVLTTAAARFAVSGVYEYTANVDWQHAAGWLGLALGALAVYAAWATQLEDVRGKTILPTGRLGKGRVAVQGTLTDQVSELHHEAGVRQEL